MVDSKLAQTIIPVQSGIQTTGTSIMYGTAISDTADGTCLIAINGSQIVNMVCETPVRRGDRVAIALTGEQASGMIPTVITSMTGSRLDSRRYITTSLTGSDNIRFAPAVSSVGGAICVRVGDLISVSICRVTTTTSGWHDILTCTDMWDPTNEAIATMQQPPSPSSIISAVGIGGEDGRIRVAINSSAPGTVEIIHAQTYIIPFGAKFYF